MSELQRLINSIDACPYISVKQATRWKSLVWLHRGAFGE